MVRNPAPRWARDALQRRGVLHLPPTSRRIEVLCVDARENLALLAPLDSSEPLQGIEGCSGELRITHAAGMLHLSGSVRGPLSLTRNGVLHSLLRLEVRPDGVAHTNRRSSFRVSGTFKGEVSELRERATSETPETAMRTRVPQPHLQALAERLVEGKRPCVIQDVSVGGVRLTLAAPLTRGGQVVLDVNLGPRCVLRGLTGTVVGTGRGHGLGVFSHQARIRFDRLPPKLETLLAREVNRIQIETLRKGVRG